MVGRGGAGKAFKTPPPTSLVTDIPIDPKKLAADDYIDRLHLWLLYLPVMTRL